MSKRIEALTALKKYVEDGKNVKCVYVTEVDGETCYCAIGFLGAQYGVSDYILRAHNQLPVRHDKIKKLLQPLANDISAVELSDIQIMNDQIKFDRSQLMDYIDQLIKKG